MGDAKPPLAEVSRYYVFYIPNPFLNGVPGEQKGLKMSINGLQTSSNIKYEKLIY